MKKPRVCIVHEYLIQYGGAEKTLESISEIFPDAPIYTSLYNPKSMSDAINSKNIITPRSMNNPFFKILRKYFTFLMPLVFENFDLREFDLVISDGTAWSKGILTTPQQLHISYVHTPPRFLYKYTVESTKRFKWYFKPIIPFLDFLLRIWDYNAAQRPDFLIANSQTVADRIQKFYRRKATVIYPPVKLANIQNVPDQKTASLDSANQPFKSPYYLALGRLASYKNFDLLVKAFNLTEMHLVIAGTGKEEKNLKKIAKQNIRFVGRVTESQKWDLYKNCLGVIFPVEDEDFGIVPVEAMSAGKPVLAHKSGGPTETIIQNETGMFFENLSIEELVSKLKEFDDLVHRNAFNPNKISETTKIFSESKFKKEFYDFTMDKYQNHFN